MYFSWFLRKEFTITKFAWHSYSLHVIMHIFGYKIIIITQEKIVAIFLVPVFQLFLGLAHLVIFSWRFKLNTAPTKVLTIVYNHEIRLAFGTTLFPTINSFGWSIL